MFENLSHLHHLIPVNVDLIQEYVITILRLMLGTLLVIVSVSYILFPLMTIDDEPV